MARPLGVLYGNVTTTGVTFVAVSIADTAVALTINGTNYNIAMAAFGGGRAAADAAGNVSFGFYGTVAVPLPTAFTRYAWTATQGSASVSGTALTAPGPTDDFMLALTTCTQSAPRAYPTSYECLDALRRTSKLPLVAILHCDDISYADNFFTSSLINKYDSQNRGIGQSTGVSPFSQSEYDYAFSHASVFGVAGPVLDAPDSYAWATFHTPAFRACLADTAFMPQWGDHEFSNDFGWSSSLTTIPNAYHKTANGFDGDGLVAYNKVFAPLQGTRARNADTTANHWYADFGPVRYVAPDTITNAIPLTQLISSAQIDDIKDVVYAGKQHFTLIGWGTFAARNSGELSGFANAPMFSIYKTNSAFFQSEYDTIFRSTGLPKKAFMDDAKTNGVGGVLLNFRGDWHSCPCFYWSRSASAGLAAEAVYEIGLTTTNDSSGFPVQYSGTSFDIAGGALVGGTYTGTLPGASQEGGARATDCTVVIVEVYGSESPPRIVVKRYDICEYFGTGTPEEYIDMRDSVVEGPYDLFTAGGASWGVTFQRTFYPWSANGNKGYKRDEPAPHYPRGAIGAD